MPTSLLKEYPFSSTGGLAWGDADMPVVTVDPQAISLRFGLKISIELFAGGKVPVSHVTRYVGCRGARMGYGLLDVWEKTDPQFLRIYGEDG
ncbi:MAG: hypothetical protein BA870_03335 [Desulfuromonadales bacterium C00003094]|jgi:hypothetical protein|nr:MAG: hypothetical protein BA870_03335 [Desulfuromonadales bacterium C00003094]OEU77560.1 MAG: hypothetical protein BA869_02895 [Desulfuromonadales bacterium C00003107]